MSRSPAQFRALLTIKSPQAKKVSLALIRILKNGCRSPSIGYVYAYESDEYNFVSTDCFVRSIIVHLPDSSSAIF